MLNPDSSKLKVNKHFRCSTASIGSTRSLLLLLLLLDPPPPVRASGSGSGSGMYVRALSLPLSLTYPCGRDSSRTQYYCRTGPTSHPPPSPWRQQRPGPQPPTRRRLETPVRRLEEEETVDRRPARRSSSSSSSSCAADAASRSSATAPPEAGRRRGSGASRGHRGSSSTGRRSPPPPHRPPPRPSFSAGTWDDAPVEELLPATAAASGGARSARSLLASCTPWILYHVPFPLPSVIQAYFLVASPSRMDRIRNTPVPAGRPAADGSDRNDRR